MLNEFTPLQFSPLQSSSGVVIAPLNALPRVTLESPALLVMTDFTQTPAAAIEPAASVDYANDYMRRRNVRSLIVTADRGEVVGILTATDVLGEKPVKFALDNGVPHAEIRVSDIMTPRSQLELLTLDSVRASRVGHIIATHRAAGRQHFLVQEHTEHGERVRGIFSLSQIARQLGVALEVQSFASTFAEIEAALSH